MLISLLFVSLFAQASAPAVESKEFPVEGLTKLEATNRSGAIKISAHEGPRAVVKVTKTLWAPTCVLRMARAGERLLVKVEQSGFVDTDDCRADLEIQVPRKVNLEIAEGSGGVDIAGIEGSLNFKIGSGSLKGDGLFSSVSGDTGSGRVTLDGVSGGGHLNSGSGNFELKFAKTALKGNLQINVASGNATLFFPKGAKVQSQLTAVSGKVTNELGESANADFKVLMRAASGNLSIKAY